MELSKKDLVFVLCIVVRPLSTFLISRFICLVVIEPFYCSYFDIFRVHFLPFLSFYFEDFIALIIFGLLGGFALSCVIFELNLSLHFLIVILNVKSEEFQF